MKSGLGITGAIDGLLTKVIAVKQYMINAGVTQEQVETELGIATLTVGVNDLWNDNSGETKFSEAFSIILLPQLMVVSLPDE